MICQSVSRIYLRVRYNRFERILGERDSKRERERGESSVFIRGALCQQVEEEEEAKEVDNEDNVVSRLGPVYYLYDRLFGYVENDAAAARTTSRLSSGLITVCARWPL